MPISPSIALTAVAAAVCAALQAAEGERQRAAR